MSWLFKNRLSSENRELSLALKIFCAGFCLFAAGFYLLRLFPLPEPYQKLGLIVTGLLSFLASGIILYLLVQALPEPSSCSRLALRADILAALIFGYILIVNAWAVDDIYITFRTVYNFTHGYGLTWNVCERVMAYTHPLWMFLMSALSYAIPNYFFLAVIPSFLLSMLAFAIGVKAIRQQDALKKPFFLLVLLLASKAFMDYTSSGLENPLSYFFAALFLAKFLGPKKTQDLTSGELFYLFFLGCLAFLNRYDTLLLYLPALAWLFFLNWKTKKKEMLKIAGLAFIPAAAWILFAFFYYGFPVPNTAYAKLIDSGLPVVKRLIVGSTYLFYGFPWDSFSYLLLTACFVQAFRRRCQKIFLVLIGVLLYVFYFMTSAVVSSHMIGRFFSVPLFIAALILVLTSSRRTLNLFSVVAIAYLTFWQGSSLYFGTVFSEPVTRKSHFFIDTKFYAHLESCSLVSYIIQTDCSPREQPLGNNLWFKDGQTFRESADRVSIGGPNNCDAMGYFGFEAGPEKFVIDHLGLTDPLLSKIPVDGHLWWPGHFMRRLPEGYFESVAKDENLVKDQDLHLYYEKIRLVTRGKLWNGERLKEIVKLNLGCYEYLIDNYLERQGQESPKKIPIGVFASLARSKFLRVNGNLR